MTSYRSLTRLLKGGLLLKVILNRKELLAAASQAALIAPSNSPIKELEYTLLENDTLPGYLGVTATNLEVTLKRQIPIHVEEEAEFSFAVGAKFFAAMLNALGDETVTLTLKGEQLLTLESGSASYCVSVLPGKNYPRLEIPFPDDTVKVSAVPAMIRRSVFAVSDNSNTPLLNCVHLRFTKDGLRAVGSDGTCIVSALGDKQSTGNISFLIPATSLSKLEKLCDDSDIFSVGATGKSIVFMKEHFAFSTRQMEGRYVDTDKMIEYLKPTFTVLLDAVELRRGVASVAPLSENNKITFCFRGEQLELRCDGGNGAASMMLATIPLTGSPQGEFCYASSRLEKSLRVMKGTLTLGIAQQGMLTLSADETFYMQSPVRQKKKNGSTVATKAA